MSPLHEFDGSGECKQCGMTRGDYAVSGAECAAVQPPAVVVVGGPPPSDAPPKPFGPWQARGYFLPVGPILSVGMFVPHVRDQAYGPNGERPPAAHELAAENPWRKVL